MISSSGQSPLSVTPTDCSHPALFELNRYHDPAQQQPVRTIQFEDSCPEAVHAVIRYIYLGQKPVLEPYCGYTVKDLMALASYLQIPPLEEYCVQLVIGTHRDTTASASEDEYGSDILNCYSSIHSHRHTRRQQLQSRISPEMAVQVLFDWGYKYPKIRTTLVCALIDSELFSDEDMLCGQEVEEGGGGGLLRSFAGHEAFHSILCEIVERQLTRRLV
ncbi:hypothetical protein EC991_000176 [Linnemannia zychae]|nr:hypothetical protein EC991_000176 [Linnemannia zychae]